MMTGKELVKMLRPLHWVKNFAVYAPLVFSENIFDPSKFLKTSMAFAVFCLLSGAVYILNDLMDIKEDRMHPVKRNRPLASGRVSKRTGITVFIVVSVAAFLVSFLLPQAFRLAAVSYYLLLNLYSICLKHVVILDVLIIASGFILRVAAGAFAISVIISPWLLICTLLLALFLALAKRRHELMFLESKAENHRPILAEYSPHLLDQMISVVTSATVVTYCLYTIAEETVTKFGTHELIFTVPFVLYGIFRYLYLIHQRFEGGSPEMLLIKDKALLINVILWITSAGLIIYLRG